MKNLLPLSLFFLFSQPGFSQDLVNSRTGSYYSFIYRITNEEAHRRYASPESSIGEGYFHDLVDYYPADSVYRGQLPIGHYLIVKAERQNLTCSLHSNNSLEMNILTNNRDLMVTFRDGEGHEIVDIKPRIGSRYIPYDAVLKAFRIPKTNRRGILRVVYQGHENNFSVHRRFNNTLPVRAKRRILGTFPFNYLFSPIRYVTVSAINFIKYRSLSPPGIYYRVSNLFREKTYLGHVTLSQPRYKPGDTVKLKAYIFNKKGNPISHPLTVSIDNYSAGGKKTLGKTYPYRPGAYLFTFVLKDSLKLLLDRKYQVYFQDRRDNNYPEGIFYFEQYELKQNFYSIRADANALPEKGGTIFLKGNDANDLPLYDVKVEIIVKPDKFIHQYEKTVFVPDTLWKTHLALDPIGETKVTLPDTIFFPGALHYEVSATFINADNERQAKSLTLFYDRKVPEVTIKTVHDSIVVTPRDHSTTYRLSLSDQHGQVLQEKEFNGMYRVKINPYVHTARVWDGKKTLKTFSLQRESAQLDVQGIRTKDSLTLVVQNPRKLLFRYQLFKNNTVVKKGSGEQLEIRKKTSPGDNYYFSIQYVWAGRPENMDYDLPFSDKPLSIALQHSPTVQPGQAVDIRISVNDAYGSPVKGADLTAYAITKKFRDSPEDMLSFQRSKGRKIFNVFTEEKLTSEAVRYLEFGFWKHKLGLDSIEFYHFLYPDSLYLNYSVADDSITQVAPYVVRNGYPQSVYYIYFDREVKYYSAVESLEPYSFRANPHKTNIVIRLWDKRIVLKDVPVMKGRKLILSIDLDHLPQGVTVEKCPTSLTAAEIAKLSPHFMKVSRDRGQSPAYLQQGNSFHPLRSLNQWEIETGELVGPFFPGNMEFVSDFSLSFSFKPGMTYGFSPRLVEREKTYSFIRKKIGYNPISFSFRDQVWTYSKITAFMKKPVEEVLYRFRPYPDNRPISKNSGNLYVSETMSDAKALAYFILNLDQPDDYYIYPTDRHLITSLLPGRYQTIVIFRDERYLKPAPVWVRPYGTLYLDVMQEKLMPPDTFSREVIRKIAEWSVQGSYVAQGRDIEMQRVRELFYRREAENTEEYSGGQWITGRVLDESGNPLPGVNVILKGTVHGTVTDADGVYRLYAPDQRVLVFSFIGYQSQEALAGHETDVVMEPDVMELSEVVVVGYGVQRRSNLTGSVVSVLQGKLAGVVRGNVMGANDSVNIRIRGVSTMEVGRPSLVLVDGVLKSWEEVDQSMIKGIEILNSAEAVALYGSRASHGIILISTETAMNKAQLLKMRLPEAPSLSWADEGTGNSLRKNFRDCAFWQPRLTTDGNGQARFTATFPDDITRWDIRVLGMASKKRTGQASSTLQSFRPLSAQLSLPLFLVEGDQAWGIGKITHYGNDSITVARTVTVNGREMVMDKLMVQNSHIDTIALRGEGDTLSVKYGLAYNRYEDGEWRKIKVFPKGSLESIGYFIPMSKDTSFRLSLDSLKGKVHVRAYADVTDVLLDEIETVKIYPYECNEQLASKLKVLLAEQGIREFRKEKFRHAALVNKIIKKLVANQAKDGGWSWWGAEKGKIWITLHVAEAFRTAEKLKYTLRYDRAGLKDFLYDHYASAPTVEQQLRTMIFLAQSGEKTMARSWVDSLNKKIPGQSHYQKLLSQALLAYQGEEVDWTWIMSQKRETLKGNWYWGEERKSIWDNAVDYTLLVYALMEHVRADDPRLIKLKGYFLEKRERHWANTYESARIIETLLPSMLRQGESRPTSMQLGGGITQQVDRFPFEQEVAGIPFLTVSKKGDNPVYLTVFEERWNPTPARREGEFTMTTTWGEGRVEILKAGKPVDLKVTVDVKKDAEYVMISVPIPGGCSYGVKEQSRLQGEVHREYDLHETRIYCERMKPGRYSYTVSLVPRYKGHFQLNPAKVEWMYFPVVFGRESLKEIEIN